MLSVTLQSADALDDRLARLPQAMRDALADKLADLGQRLADKVRDELSGPMLRVRSGRLRASVTAVLAQDGDRLSAEIAIGQDLPYAAIQILGGKIAAHEVVARNGQVLRFMIAGQPVFARRVRVPEVILPAHPVMQAALDALGPDAAAELTQLSADLLAGAS
jgi:phage gpG-like protein